ncbi:MAG: hypothetical protein CVU43_19770 [Chloroflexi bacterium HGW-Chloroflexi-5]|jgi:DMSO/TMAO reductase YedYZ heme-binding membrane subunit|nr:MAG: hypothetical protein CVU54_13425 [Deltaproteobacteria bacterium HGW-Deltaproteobacteria-12]PKN96615.1 MAG: hypothetical protein CVU43_19770 [Chloroflexi bacterium HGW-Chloroflexi-5]
MKHGKGYLVLFEMILIVGSIPVFRSVWMVFDSIEFMNHPAGILLSFAAGIFLCVMALIALNKVDKEKQTGSYRDNLML